MAVIETRLIIFAFSAGLLGLSVQGEIPATNAIVFTAQLETKPAPPIALVSHSDPWRYRKGSNAPPARWQTIAEADLDSSWLTGPGGFGYGDDDDATVLSDMRGQYTTVYIRRTFEMPSGVNSERHLLLTMDWDDGFLAYLDGVEIARALIGGPPGIEPSFRATASGSHEASKGDAFPNAPTIYDLGAVGNRLQAASHILAIQGLNQSIDGLDFSLSADLSVDGADTQITDGRFIGIVKTNAVTLFGTNTLPSSARVLVNGANAALVDGKWSLRQELSAGVNRITINVVNAAGQTLATTNKTIVLETSKTRVGGVLESNTIWTPANGIIRVTNNAFIPAGGTLTISPGAVVLIEAGRSIAGTNAVLKVSGTELNPVLIAPADGVTAWGPLLISGPQGNLHIHNAELVAGHVEVLESSTGLIEDSYLHDYISGSTPIIHTLRAASFTERRCHVARYYEHLIQLTPALVEDCLCEYIFGDGIDFDGAPPGSTIRRCTVRHGNDTNIDGIDMGTYPEIPTKGVLIEECLIYDFPFDKGISIGEACADMIVRNCVIYGVDSGIAVKDSSVATISNNTIADSNNGISLYEKNPRQGGGHATGTNNIFWGNKNSVSITNDSTAVFAFSDIAGTNAFPGTNNINRDPAFVNPAMHDYRLSANSPCLKAGLGGTNMGALVLAGSSLVDGDGDKLPDLWELANGLDPNDASDAEKDRDGDAFNERQEFLAGTNPLDLLSNLKVGLRSQGSGDFSVSFNAAPGKSYSVLYSDDAGRSPWLKLQDVPSATLAREVQVKISPGEKRARFYRIVTPSL